MNIENKSNTFKIWGVLITVALYIISFFGTGEIYLFDRGHLPFGSPYFSIVAVIIMAVYSALVGYYCKTKGEKSLFLSIYITLVLPYICWALAMLLEILGISVVFALFYMPVLPVTSVMYSLAGMADGNVQSFLALAAFPTATIAIAPIVYKVTE